MPARSRDYEPDGAGEDFASDFDDVEVGAVPLPPASELFGADADADPARESVR